ncbi:MAG: hypothetical protein AKCLJLPJ_02483 [Fimbriimonadales bacterium]|nr:hypothetical protein [Fimbriimonadales bacterium]
MGCVWSAGSARHGRASLDRAPVQTPVHTCTREPWVASGSPALWDAVHGKSWRDRKASRIRDFFGKGLPISKWHVIL